MRSKNRIERELPLGFISTCPAIPRTPLITESQFCFCFSHGKRDILAYQDPKARNPNGSRTFLLLWLEI